MSNPDFSQVFPTFSSAWYCQWGYPFSIAADDYSASGLFSTIRIWGGDFYGCTLAPTEMFKVFIWDGKPGSGGNLVYSSPLPGTTTPIGVYFGSTPIYQIDINFGTNINLFNGWIGITRIGASCWTGYDFGFAWLFDNYGAGNSIQYYNGTWLDSGTDTFFCLGGGEPEVPISNRALFIGIGLIVVFAVVRFRKMV